MTGAEFLDRAELAAAALPAGHGVGLRLRPRHRRARHRADRRRAARPLSRERALEAARHGRYRLHGAGRQARAASPSRSTAIRSAASRRAVSQTPLQFECGGGCAVSTASDYLRFAAMLLNKGQLRRHAHPRPQDGRVHAGKSARAGGEEPDRQGRPDPRRLRLRPRARGPHHAGDRAPARDRSATSRGRARPAPTGGPTRRRSWSVVWMAATPGPTALEVPADDQRARLPGDRGLNARAALGLQVSASACVVSSMVMIFATGRRPSIAARCTSSGEGRAAVLDHGAVELAHMGVAHGRGDAAIGDDAGEDRGARCRTCAAPIRAATCGTPNRRSSRR